ncbi:MAG: hypothetical protein LBT46_12865 [Planctomycetaceae bacterium]|nr:hypothetical protein [Planctomycetaceae bacterium]
MPIIALTADVAKDDRNSGLEIRYGRLCYNDESGCWIQWRLPPGKMAAASPVDTFSITVIMLCEICL